MEVRARLEKTLGLSLAPTVVFDHPTVQGLAGHVAGMLFDPPASGAAPGRTAVEAMSDAEVEALLLKQLELS
jgi:hypothetical protein